MHRLALVRSNPEPLMLEGLDFYRPWCRYCGATEGSCVIADEDMDWVEDEDDLGYPVCTSCIEAAQKEN